MGSCNKKARPYLQLRNLKYKLQIVVMYIIVTVVAFKTVADFELVIVGLGN